jgi:hypothetical protein
MEMDGAGCTLPSGQGGDSGANPAAVASQIIGGLFGRKQSGADAETPSTATPVGRTTTALVILRLSSELTAIDVAPLTADTFQAPAGFKKVDQ